MKHGKGEIKKKTTHPVGLLDYDKHYWRIPTVPHNERGGVNVNNRGPMVL